MRTFVLPVLIFSVAGFLHAQQPNTVTTTAFITQGAAAGTARS